MKQILLVIDGDVPSRPVFQYAAGLCKRVAAGLCILQFLKQRQIAPAEQAALGLDRADGQSTFPASRMLWRTDEHLAGVPESLKKMLNPSFCGVPFSVALSADKPENVLSGYIDAHHDIILTVFDPSRGSERTSGRIRLLKKTLGVPLVVVGHEKKAVVRAKRARPDNTQWLNQPRV